MSQPPINGGYLRVVGGRVMELGRSSVVRAEHCRRVDLGDVALLPKLVNAHTHLEFSDCREVIGQSGIPLAQWIAQVIAARGSGSADNRKQAIAAGLAESIAAGVGWIGDIATTPSTYPLECVANVVSFAEVLGLSVQRSQERFASALQHAETLEEMDSGDSIAFGISPHAPYSTPLAMVDQCAALARQRGSALAMHVAESPDERDLLASGSGRFADALLAAGLWRAGVFPWSSPRPLESLIACLATAPRALLVHGNDLRGDEIRQIAAHRHLSVVYCPRTHDFFGYGPHPVQSLLDAGIRVAIGTDSRASNPDLSVWREIQFLLRRRPDLDPMQILEMATLCGADALFGPGGHAARIVPGLTPIDEMMTVSTSATDLDQVWQDFAERDLLCTPLPLRA